MKVLLCIAVMGGALDTPAQVLDIGDGSRVVIARTGAYVPLRWIDTAADSVGQWRLGADREKLARLVLGSMGRELEATRSQVEHLRMVHLRDSLALAEVDRMAGATLDQLTDDLQQQRDRNVKQRPWATLGKVTVGALAVLAAAVTINTLAP